jgi:hypothetical protein
VPWCAGMWNDMGVNKHLPHLFVLPEDDANRQLAVGFVLGVDTKHSRQIYILPVAGGWTQVLERFLTDEATDMEAWPHRYMVLLIDFDKDERRLDNATSRIPLSLRDRVFILGSWTEPEDLKRNGLGSPEIIGSAIARECEQGTGLLWEHNLLRHNLGELNRLRPIVCPILF